MVGFSQKFLPFVFCLGHGLSAGLVFVLLWFLYDTVGSRNWSLLKFGVRGPFVCLCVVGSLCSASSLPPTISFFSEVYILLESGGVSSIFLFIFFCYLFLSGLVPLFILGGCFSRHFRISGFSKSYSLGGFAIFYLVIACFFFFTLF